MKKITLITGGQRSGKSSFAESQALSLTSNPIHIATSRIWDEEFRQRIKQHQDERGDEWTNIEEEKNLSRIRLDDGDIAVIDCVTLWATNFFHDMNGDCAKVLVEIKKEFNQFTKPNAHYIFVTNELGLGGVAENALQRKFTDVLGYVNQYLARKANEVHFIVSGLSMKIK